MRKAKTGKNKKDNLTLFIYNDLLAKLMSNELAPGTIIDRNILAEQYNVSVAPVRDALTRLTLEGFIVTKPYSGTVVKAISREDVIGNLVMREALETQAVRMIHGKKIQDHYDELRGLAIEIENCSDQTAYWYADVAFHQELVSLCECPLLINNYDQIMSIGNFYRINTFLMNNDPTKRSSHIELLEHLKSEDVQEAVDEIIKHLHSGKEIQYLP